jgi:type III pantothenate kinase
MPSTGGSDDADRDLPLGGRHAAGSHPSICTGDAVLLADVGNSRIKLALVQDHAADGEGTARRLPSLTRRQNLDSRGFHPANFEEWLRATSPGSAVILLGSVHDAAAARLEATIAELAATQHRSLRQRRIRPDDLPLHVAVDEPAKVGIDRLAAAAAANLLRQPDHAAVVIDCGTAVTVDLVSAGGVFLGGAILPGATLMARGLADGTSKLPHVAALEHSLPPPMPGRSTAEAIAAGIGWGFRGAVVRLVEEARRTTRAECDVVLTGGWRSAVRDELPGVIEQEDLVLEGLALAARTACSRLLG